MALSISRLGVIQPIQGVSKAQTKKYRHRRTKAEIEASRRAESQNNEAESQQQDLPKQKKHISSYWDRAPSHMVTTDEVCEQMLQQAYKDNLENPSFDFRLDYEKGQILYYVDYNKICGTIEVVQVKINSIYPRVLVAYVDGGEAYCIDYEQRDLIFEFPKDAEKKMKQMKKELKL